MKNNKTKMDAIGNVVMNYNYYSGEDFYSEGNSEDVLLEIVKNNKESDYDHIIQNSRSWSVMYHLSQVRENIASWLPIKKTDKVLEIGSGCGAVTGCLSDMAESVTCIELSKKRSLINAYRHKTHDNIEIVVGNFEDIEPEITEQYDYITLIGVLEYAESYIHSENPYEDFLKIVSKHLKKEGKLIIAIENKFGLKYFAGCKEDHTGRFFEGIEGYSTSTGVKTFSHDGLRDLLRKTGFESRFYYPYPDYKLPATIYSDRWLPKKGELVSNLRNFDNDRVVLFDEAKVFDSLIEEGKFSEVANSFLVMATVKEINKEDVLPVYVKYANDRSSKYRIATVISSDYYGKEKSVVKRALTPLANSHVDEIYINYSKLSKSYEHMGLKPNVCKRVAGTDMNLGLSDGNTAVNSEVGFEFIRGMTLENYLCALESMKSYERMLLLMKQYEAMVLAVNKKKFKKTDAFVKIFGDYSFEDYASGDVCDLDIIFSNIVFDKDKKENGEWNLLDYEWTFDFPIPAKFVIYRALYYYEREHGGSDFFKYIDKRGLDLYKEFHISEEEKAIFFEMEKHFQIYIIGAVASLEVLHELMPVQTLDFEEAIEDEMYLRNLNNPRIYYNSGEGYDEERQLYIFGTVSSKGHVRIDIPLDSDVKEVRIDPTDYPCIVSLKRADMEIEDGSFVNLDRYLTNGYLGLNSTLLFDTYDAQILFKNLGEGKKIIHLDYVVSMVDKSLFQELKQLFAQKMDRDAKDVKLLDKLKSKKTTEILPEGFWYNK